MVGDREASAGTVSVRLRNTAQVIDMGVDDFVGLVSRIRDTRSADLIVA